MKDGINKSLETLADIGDEVQKKALEAGYGPTVAAASVKKLVTPSSISRCSRVKSSTKCARCRPKR